VTNDPCLDEHDRLARLFGLIAVRAGEAIMQARASAADPTYKSDGSPVTAADLEADEIIRQCLQRNVPHLPVITEENLGAPVVDADRFILVDPLDGTREFIQGSDEFTVNIALIENRTPVAGAVYAPARPSLHPEKYRRMICIPGAPTTTPSPRAAVDANRRNPLRSTGPNTEGGKRPVAAKRRPLRTMR
jgi:3'(2'), 5'-bisphosphate nucleotidase